MNQKLKEVFKITTFTPFQVSVINLDEYIEKRKEFTTDEWIDTLINSCGLDPGNMTHRQKLLYICRCIPLVETNVNMIELAQRETGKTYLYRNISYYAHVLSGGKATPALLKLQYPDGKVTDEELEEIVLMACEHRQRVREQLHLIAPGEYERLKLGVKMLPSGKQVGATLPDADRVQKVTLPKEPSVGEVIGLAVEGDHSCILHFEMQATSGCPETPLSVIP